MIFPVVELLAAWRGAGRLRAYSQASWPIWLKNWTYWTKKQRFFRSKSTMFSPFRPNHYFCTFGINLRLRLLARSETIQNCLQAPGVILRPESWTTLTKLQTFELRIQECIKTYIYCQYRPNLNSRTNWYFHNFQMLVVERETWYLCFLWGWHLLFCVNTSETSSDLFVDKKKRQ